MGTKMIIRDSMYDLGIELRRTMFGAAGAEGQVGIATDVDEKLQDFVTRYCFGDIWQRPGLDLSDRSKITLAILIATGKSPQIRLHMRGALENGVSPVELREVVIHSMLYCGIPAAVEGISALYEVLDEKDIDTKIDDDPNNT
jgi:4-carboxymuconolactone decarboxylase